MTTIWKYKLESRMTKILIPQHAKYLRASIDPHGMPSVWAVVDPNNAKIERTFYIIGTGQEMPEEWDKYIGSYHNGPFVWHVFVN